MQQPNSDHIQVGNDGGFAVLEPGDTRLIFAQPPGYTILTFEKALIDRIMVLLKDHPERAIHLNNKLNVAIDDIITLEEFAMKIGYYDSKRAE